MSARDDVFTGFRVNGFREFRIWDHGFMDFWVAVRL